jgi:hypothetical protein
VDDPAPLQALGASVLALSGDPALARDDLVVLGRRVGGGCV